MAEACECTSRVMCEPCLVAERTAQGLPPHVEDPEAIRVTAEVLDAAARRKEREPAA